MEEAIDPYKEYGVATPNEINQDLDAAARRVNNLPEPETLLEESRRKLNELMFKNIHYSAEDVVTIYGALRTYLKVLSQQPEEDLKTIARVTQLMIAIKPQAVEASQEIAGRENNARTT